MISLEIAQNMLTKWLEAELALTTGQEYEIDTGGSKRRLTRASLSEVRKSINYWSTMVDRIKNNKRGPTVRLVTPRDL